MKNSLITDQLKKIFYFTTFLGSLSLDPENDMKEEKCAICGDTEITMPYITKEFFLFILIMVINILILLDANMNSVIIASKTTWKDCP